ncbi:hypothetical protein Taro_017310 [Colocasia esculenta]|uniref:Uncharacterized protein n=1 Tax=Colocasia esculenta TaxID=4460 RepID=A0A843USX1_COLES|nr:hypothetical protein [Colocasia esculenta]
MSTMASRGRRGRAPAREDEPRREERTEQQAPTPQGPVLPPSPPVDYGVFLQGLVQVMQTQAHTQAALQAQLEAQHGAPAPAAVAAAAPAIGRSGRTRAPVRVFALAHEDAEQAEHVTKAMASRGRRGGVPACEGEQRREEQVEQQVPAPQGPVLPRPPPVDYGVFMQGGQDAVVSRGEQGFAEEACSYVPVVGQEESSVLTTVASGNNQQCTGTFSTFPWCEEGVSPLREDTWWYKMLDDCGKVLEVQKQ